MAQFSSNNSVREDEERPKGTWSTLPRSSLQSREPSTGGAPDQARPQAAEGKNGKLHLGAAGWIVEEAIGKGVRVAPWVVKEQKKSLYNSLVGFWPRAGRNLVTEMPINIQKLEEEVV